jgi:hypothetical protein
MHLVRARCSCCREIVVLQRNGERRDARSNIIRCCRGAVHNQLTHSSGAISLGFFAPSLLAAAPTSPCSSLQMRMLPPCSLRMASYAQAIEDEELLATRRLDLPAFRQNLPAKQGETGFGGSNTQPRRRSPRARSGPLRATRRPNATLNFWKAIHPELASGVAAPNAPQSPANCCLCRVSKLLCYWAV